MSKKRKIIFFLKLIFLSFLICLIIIACSFVVNTYATSHKTDAANMKNDDMDTELSELLSNNNQSIQSSGQAQEGDADADTADIADAPSNDSSVQDAESADFHATEMKLLDIYSESGTVAIFKCFDSEAESYEWEYYDITSKTWAAADPEDVQIYEDELQRKISGYKIEAERSNDKLMVRCTLHFPEKEDECQTASLFILKDKVKKIEAEDIEAEANTCLCARELPVKITYEDGTDEVITGLNNLYFIKTEEKKDYSTTISGNRIETITQIITEYDYLNIGLNEEKEEVIRYRPDLISNEIIETKMLITGKDLTAPEIYDINIMPFEVSNIDKPVTLSISISADDNETPYPYLEYAFLFSDQEPTDADWIKKSSFDVNIERNGVYIAYVKDQSGNIAKMEKEIITVDSKAPVILSVTLSNEENWCKSNTIMVEAKDAEKMLYCFKNIDDDTSSNWITDDEYFIDKNGTYAIQVKDAAGNISEAEVTVNNIDNKAPIIRSINIK